jgi:ferredoxin--NADP+ reductase
VCSVIDQEALAKEFARIRPRLEAVGQNPDEILKDMLDEFTKCEPLTNPSKIGFRFLASPRRVLTDGQNRVRALEVEETKLEPKGEDTAAVGLKQYYEFPCDSVVFAVGDRVDETLGLPYKNGVFVTNPSKTNHDPDDALFQAYDEASGKVIDGVFLAGWARKASEGLVGVAKRDGEWCSEVVSRYLNTQPVRDRSTIDGVVRRLRGLLEERKVQAVDAAALRLLEKAEQERSPSNDGIGEFKFSSNQEMLAQVRDKRETCKVPAGR